MDAHDERPVFERQVTRRGLLRYAAAGVGGASLAALLAACGGNGEEAAPPPPAQEPQPVPPVSTTEPAPPATTDAEPQAAAGGILKLAIGDGQSGDSLDPALQFTGVGLTAGGMIYDNLLHVDTDWNLTPMLAEDYTVSPDASEWSFRIRQGVEFHSGKTLEAADVEAHVKRILDENTGSGGLGLFEPVLDASGISVPDPTTITFTLKAPDAFFGVKMGHYYTRVPEAGTTDWTGPSPGTGPFKNVSFKPGEGFEFVRNENYWQSGQPLLDGINCVVIPEQATRVEGILTGDIDVTDPPPFSAVEQITSSEVADLFQLPTTSPYLYDIDTSIEPYSNPDVRKALKMLIDREKAVQIIVLGNGFATADSFVPPNDPFYPADLQPPPYDPEQAKALLQQAGYGDGWQVDAWTTKAYPYLDEGAAFLKEQWAVAGIEVRIQSVSNDRYLAAFLNEPLVMDYALTQHPALVFDLFYVSTSGLNVSRIKDEQIDAWVAEFKATLDPTKQKELSGEIIKRYSEVAAELVPFQFDKPWPYKTRVQGMIADPMANIDFRQTSLA